MHNTNRRTAGRKPNCAAVLKGENMNQNNTEDLKRIEIEDAFIAAFSSLDEVFQRVGIDRIPPGKH